MFKQLFYLLIGVAMAMPTLAQSPKPAIGSGLAVQFGLNPKSDYLSWSFENSELLLFPSNRTYIGPTFQYRSYQRFQLEGSLFYSRAHYENRNPGISPIRNVFINEWELPLGLNVNMPSPVRLHSAIVYRLGLIARYRHIPQTKYINTTYHFFTPSIYSGIRLATDTRALGRLEYGIDIIKNINQQSTFFVAYDDVAPTAIDLKQRGVQVNVSLVYFFSPRVKNWGKERYGMDSLIE